MDDLRELATTLRERGISLCMDLVLNHVAREHEWAAKARAGDPIGQVPRLLPRLHRRGRARRLRADAAGGLPRLRARATSPGTTTCRPGSGRRSTSSSGTSTGPTRRSSWSSRRSSSAWPTWASRCCGSTRSRSSGSGWAPTARTSPRCTRSPRRCGRSPGSPRRPSRSRPRRSSARATWCSTSAPGGHAGRVSDLAYHNSLMVQVWSMLAARNTVLARQALGSLPAEPRHRHLDHLRPLPRRHRLGDRRPGRARRRHHRSRAPGVPVRLVLRRVPGHLGRRAGLPGQPGDG